MVEDIEGLVTRLTDGITGLEEEIAETQATLVQVNNKLDSKTNQTKKWLRGIIASGVVAFSVGGVLWYDSHQDTARLTRNCRENRQTIKSMIEIAVADRPVLSTSSPETAAAIEDLNNKSVRPLRNRLLALEGAQPEKC